MRPKQMKMPGIDTKLTNACDLFLHNRDLATKYKQDQDASGLELAEILKSMGKDAIRHAGVTIRIKRGTTTKDKIIVKAE